jgi:hypothetical protein
VSNKKVKGGSGLACLRRSTGDFVYALKGGKRNEFWAFDVARDTWLAMADVPPGERLKGMGDGSGLVAAGTRLFALKAAVNEFYAYDPVANAWLDAALLPLAGVSKGNKTARYGSALAADGNFVYAIKGGSNEFWTHAIDANVWFELETLPGMPSGKTVRNGGAIAAGGGRVWALKGNKTAEFWCYDPGSALQAGSAGPARGTQAARPATARYVDFRLYPNPVAGEHVWMWSARPVARPAVLRVLDVAGRVVVARGLVPGGSSKLQVDLGAVSAGVYVVELSGSGPTVTQKLVVER